MKAKKMEEMNGLAEQILDDEFGIDTDYLSNSDIKNLIAFLKTTLKDREEAK